MPQLRHIVTKVVLGDPTPGIIEYRGAEISTPFTRGREMSIEEARSLQTIDHEIIAPDGVWWPHRSRK